jgi:nucleotide-binding universal stress UspA family protein
MKTILVAYDDTEPSRRALDRAAILEERGIAAERLAARGEPATAIARLAEEHDVDLVVVGTRELGALQRLLGQRSARG